MPVTVEQLTRVGELGLVVRAGRGGLGRHVTWVHGSEVPDPTPWLSGGELLLTTGMRLETPERLAEYVARLAGAGAAGMGFASGVVYEGVPEAVLSTADAHEFPVLDVPYVTPFVAIAKTVSARLAAERYEGLQRAVDAQQRLIRSALDRGGLDGVARTLAAAVQGWCVVTDPGGRPLVSSPSSAAERVMGLHDDLQRCRDAGIGAMSVSGPAGYTAIHPLGVHRRTHGFLLVGREHAFTSAEQTVLSAAVTLLTLEMEQARATAEAARRFRGELVAQVLRGDLEPDDARRHVLTWGLDPECLQALVIVLNVDAVEPGDLVARMEEQLADDGVPAVAAVTGDGELSVVASGGGLEATVHLEGWGGLSDPARVVELPRAFRQARQAAKAGRADGRRVTRVTELGALQLLFRLQQQDAVESFAELVLGRLEEHDVWHGDRLVATLRTFLDNHGAYGPTASALGAHRHTIRARIGRVERLLGRSLDSAEVRLELALALRARELGR